MQEIDGLITTAATTLGECFHNCSSLVSINEPLNVTGWRIRATALRDQIASDKGRYWKFRLLHPGAETSMVEELLKDL